MAIPFYLQYNVEASRSAKYQWMNFGLQLVCIALYGVLFHWVPIYLRKKRSPTSQNYKPYFKMLKVWDAMNRVYRLKFPWFNPIFIQPSLLGLGLAYIGILVGFTFAHTKDLDYETWDYILAKRLSRMAISNFPIIYILIIKNDLVTSITGLQHDRLIMFHKWIARIMFVMICVHIYMTINYWLKLGFEVMIVIPPQIFGFIAFGSFFLLNFGSFKFIRKWAYDFFLVEHRVFSFIMLLFSFFHNMKGSESAVILAVHQLVIDRILSRVLSMIHKRTSPTKGQSVFEILDEDTILITVPLRAYDFNERKWWQVYLPKLNTWKAGQHVYLNVFKVKWFQQHPFTISSLSDTKEMKFVVKVQKGFTKLLLKKIQKLQAEKNQNSEDSSSSADSGTGNSSGSTNSEDIELTNLKPSNDSSVCVETELLPAASVTTDTDLEKAMFNEDDIVMKATFYGPVGATYQPLITFDSSLFFSAGSGSSFTFPVCLDLLKTMEARNSVDDYLGRPEHSSVRIVWCIKKVENVKWYKFILDDLLEYCNKGMLHMDIYVTQDDGHHIFNSGVVETDTSDCQDNSIHSHTEKGLLDSSHKNKSDIEKTAISFPSSGSSSKQDCFGMFEMENVSVFNGRPNLSGIVEAQSTRLTSTQDMKSLAVLSCGPDDFTNTIRESARKYKWVTDAPDIYCYTESFG